MLNCESCTHIHRIWCHHKERTSVFCCCLSKKKQGISNQLIVGILNACNVSHRCEWKWKRARSICFHFARARCWLAAGLRAALAQRPGLRHFNKLISMSSPHTKQFLTRFEGGGSRSGRKGEEKVCSWPKLNGYHCCQLDWVVRGIVIPSFFV